MPMINKLQEDVGHSGTLVSGWYGNGNLGDEAILRGILLSTRGARPDFNPTVLSDNPERTHIDFGIDSVSRTQRFKFERSIRELLAIRSKGLYVLGGGGLIRDFGSNPRGCEVWLRPVRMAQKLGKSTMTYAVGVDRPRFQKTEENVKRTLEKCDIITVRDCGSAVALRELDIQNDVTITADPAILLGAGVNRCPSEDSSIVSVAVRNWFTNGRWVDDPELFDRALSEIAVGLDALVDAFGVRIIFVPFQNHGSDNDTEISEIVLSRMRRREAAELISVPSSPMVAIELFAKSELVIGARLHSLILAAAVGTPVYGLEYSPKVAKFLNYIGLNNYHCDLSLAATPGEFSRALQVAYDSRFTAQDILHHTVPILQSLAELNGELLLALAAADQHSQRRIVANIQRAGEQLSVTPSLI